MWVKFWANRTANTWIILENLLKQLKIALLTCSYPVSGWRFHNGSASCNGGRLRCRRGLLRNAGQRELGRIKTAFDDEQENVSGTMRILVRDRRNNEESARVVQQHQSTELPSRILQARELKNHHHWPDKSARRFQSFGTTGSENHF